MTQWSNQQADALTKVGRWLSNPGDQQLFRLFGVAGTGKTTLARHLAEGVNQALFAAFTGKAASVMRDSGCTNAQTIHSLIYRPRGSQDEQLKSLHDEITGIDQELTLPDLGEERRKVLLERRMKIVDARNQAKQPRFNLNKDSDLKHADLLVLDECSMVDSDVANDLMSFGKPILVLGDPAQLPPVRGTGYFIDAKPDVMLTEIHRQARDNPIIELATRVREGETLDYGNYGDSRIIQRSSPEDIMNASQILVGMNVTRTATNRYYRRLKGWSENPFPVEGDKLVCLRNDREVGLLNGTLHTALQDAVELGDDYISLRLRSEDEGQTPDLVVQAHPQHFNGDPDSISFWERTAAQEFTYGYALTVHKAQGSGWKDVLLVDEWKSRDSRQKWLYTGITRAKERITIVRG